MFTLEPKHSDALSFEKHLRSFVANCYRDDSDCISIDLGILDALRRDAISTVDATTASIQALSK